MYEFIYVRIYIFVYILSGHFFPYSFPYFFTMLINKFDLFYFWLDYIWFSELFLFPVVYFIVCTLCCFHTIFPAFSWFWFSFFLSFLHSLLIYLFTSFLSFIPYLPICLHKARVHGIGVCYKSALSLWRCFLPNRPFSWMRALFTYLEKGILGGVSFIFSVSLCVCVCVHIWL